MSSFRRTVVVCLRCLEKSQTFQLVGTEAEIYISRLHTWVARIWVTHSETSFLSAVSWNRWFRWPWLLIAFVAIAAALLVAQGTTSRAHGELSAVARVPGPWFARLWLLRSTVAGIW